MVFPFYLWILVLQCMARPPPVPLMSVQFWQHWTVCYNYETTMIIIKQTHTVCQRNCAENVCIWNIYVLNRRYSIIFHIIINNNHQRTLCRGNNFHVHAWTVNSARKHTHTHTHDDSNVQLFAIRMRPSSSRLILCDDNDSDLRLLSTGQWTYETKHTQKRYLNGL